jgi:GNAT superfamily N-acetyltransferase
MIAFRDGRVDSGHGGRLEAAMRAEVEAMYPGLDLSAADMPQAGPAELNPPHGVFLVGYRDGEPVCCGGIKTLAPGVCEFKRMYVIPEARGAGVGRALLGALEARARALGFHTARLDTGAAQTVAQRLYLSAGYRPVENFNANPVATFFGEKPLAVM